jgi:hypothetical protein
LHKRAFCGLILLEGTKLEVMMTFRFKFLDALFHEMEVCTESEIEDELAALQEVDKQELVLGVLDDDLKQLQACLIKIQKKAMNMLRTPTVDEHDELLKQVQVSLMHNTVVMLNYVLAREVYARFNIPHIAVGPQKWGPCKIRKDGTIVRIPYQEATMVILDAMDHDDDDDNGADPDDSASPRTFH